MNNRTKWFWLGLFLMASGWQFLLPVFVPPQYWLGCLLMIAGAVVNGVSLMDAPQAIPRRSLLVYCVSAAVVMVLAPFPYSLGGFVLLGGAGLLWFAPARSRVAGIGMGVLLSGVMLIAVSACLPVLASLGCAFHKMRFAAPLVYRLFELAGYSAHCEAATVFVQGTTGIQEFAISTEYFGWTFVVPALLGAFIWHMLARSRHRWQDLLLLVPGMLLYALARYVLLALLYLDLPFFPLFWNSWILCLTFLPFFLILVGMPPRLSEVSGEGRSPASPTTPFSQAAHLHPPHSRALAAAFALALALICLVAAWGWEDAGQAKPRRLVIDEAHSTWEKIDRKYDTEWFGEESGYNYYCLAKFLGYYYELRHNTDKITDALLADCDVLLIKTPTAAFTADELDAIERFVRRGGGLLLIGDHTNVFGTSTYLNAIARRFGLHYNYDATYDLPTGGLTFYEHPTLLPHPIVQAMPPFLFGTSCTVEAPLSAAIPIQGYALRVAGHDYAATSFFSPSTDGPHVGFGLFPQLAAVKCRRGRVVAFTDSTVFSNFWMFLPGKPELLLGCTEWLNRQNGRSSRSLVLCALGLLLAASAGFSLRGHFAGQFPNLFAGACIGFFLGAFLTQSANRAAYRPPTPHTRYPLICFDRQFSHFELPTEKLFHPPSVDYHTFYVWSQRVGCVPRVGSELDSSLLEAGGLVMLNPSGPLPPRSLRRLVEFVRRGGALYVFDSPTNRASAANQVLGSFGLALTNCCAANLSVFNSAGELVASNRPPILTRGGQGLLFTEQRQPVLARKREARGVVLFSGDAELFANASLGTTAAMPDETQKRLYRVVFDLFDEVKTATLVNPLPVP